jgi:DNA-damage-inducible protein D
MDDFELILTMLGERTTAEIHRTQDSKGLPKLKNDARLGGQVAGTARRQIERTTGRQIVSKNNFLLKKKKELN